MLSLNPFYYAIPEKIKEKMQSEAGVFNNGIRYFTLKISNYIINSKDYIDIIDCHITIPEKWYPHFSDTACKDRNALFSAMHVTYNFHSHKEIRLYYDINSRFEAIRCRKRKGNIEVNSCKLFIFNGKLNKLKKNSIYYSKDEDDGWKFFYRSTIIKNEKLCIKIFSGSVDTPQCTEILENYTHLDKENVAPIPIKENSEAHLLLVRSTNYLTNKEYYIMDDTNEDAFKDHGLIVLSEINPYFKKDREQALNQYNNAKNDIANFLRLINNNPEIYKKEEMVDILEKKYLIAISHGNHYRECYLYKEQKKIHHEINMLYRFKENSSQIVAINTDDIKSQIECPKIAMQSNTRKKPSRHIEINRQPNANKIKVHLTSSHKKTRLINKKTKPYDFLKYFERENKHPAINDNNGGVWRLGISENSIMKQKKCPHYSKIEKAIKNEDIQFILSIKTTYIKINISPNKMKNLLVLAKKKIFDVKGIVIYCHLLLVFAKRLNAYYDDIGRYNFVSLFDYAKQMFYKNRNDIPYLFFGQLLDPNSDIDDLIISAKSINLDIIFMKTARVKESCVEGRDAILQLRKIDDNYFYALYFIYIEIMKKSCPVALYSMAYLLQDHCQDIGIKKDTDLIKSILVKSCTHNHALSLLRLGKIYIDQKNMKEAKVLLKKALTSKEDDEFNMGVYNNLSIVLLEDYKNNRNIYGLIKVINYLSHACKYYKEAAGNFLALYKKIVMDSPDYCIKDYDHKYDMIVFMNKRMDEMGWKNHKLKALGNHLFLKSRSIYTSQSSLAAGFHLAVPMIFFKEVNAFLGKKYLAEAEDILEAENIIKSRYTNITVTSRN